MYAFEPSGTWQIPGRPGQALQVPGILPARRRLNIRTGNLCDLDLVTCTWSNLSQAIQVGLCIHRFSDRPQVLSDVLENVQNSIFIVQMRIINSIHWMIRLKWVKKSGAGKENINVRNTENTNGEDYYMIHDDLLPFSVAEGANRGDANSLQRRTMKVGELLERTCQRPMLA